MLSFTAQNPQWLHFGSGNLFRAYHSVLAQNMLEKGLTKAGIIVAESFDAEIIEKIYRANDNLHLQVVMQSNGNLNKTLVASVAQSLVADSSCSTDWQRLQTIFSLPSLQLVSFSITEKGYVLHNAQGELAPLLLNELQLGPHKAKHIMAKLVCLLIARYQAGKAPLTLLSTDNFSHNGDKLKAAVLSVAQVYRQFNFVDDGFINYIQDSTKISFPLSMIDKITPYPAARVQQALEDVGFMATQIIKTKLGSVVAPFVNTEESEYLVVEDAFVNGRPPLESVGVLLTDRETVDKVEKMKVCTCLNPLHTALAIFGNLLGFNSIADEMLDADLLALVKKIGLVEGMPVVVDPKIINPQHFLREVLEQRLPNPSIPDTPQRIATDTSQKVAIRFGETLKLYNERGLNINNLVGIPLTLAAWFRYLLGRNDNNEVFTISADPLLSYLQNELSGIEVGKPNTAQGKLANILSNKQIFGLDLQAIGLADKIENYFVKMLAGCAAVRETLHKAVSE
jgi:fructuronate reductase